MSGGVCSFGVWNDDCKSGAKQFIPRPDLEQEVLSQLQRFSRMKRVSRYYYNPGTGLVVDSKGKKPVFTVHGKPASFLRTLFQACKDDKEEGLAVAFPVEVAHKVQLAMDNGDEKVEYQRDKFHYELDLKTAIQTNLGTKMERAVKVSTLPFESLQAGEPIHIDYEVADKSQAKKAAEDIEAHLQQIQEEIRKQAVEPLWEAPAFENCPFPSHIKAHVMEGHGSTHRRETSGILTAGLAAATDGSAASSGAAPTPAAPKITPLAKKIIPITTASTGGGAMAHDGASDNRLVPHCYHQDATVGGVIEAAAPGFGFCLAEGIVGVIDAVITVRYKRRGKSKLALCWTVFKDNFSKPLGKVALELLNGAFVLVPLLLGRVCVLINTLLFLGEFCRNVWATFVQRTMTPKKFADFIIQNLVTIGLTAAALFGLAALGLPTLAIGGITCVIGLFAYGVSRKLAKPIDGDLKRLGLSRGFFGGFDVVSASRHYKSLLAKTADMNKKREIVSSMNAVQAFYSFTVT